MKFDGFSPEVAPSYALRPPEKQTLSPPVFHNWVPHLNHRTKKIIGGTIFSILLKTVHN